MVNQREIKNRVTNLMNISITEFSSRSLESQTLQTVLMTPTKSSNASRREVKPLASTALKMLLPQCEVRSIPSSGSSISAQPTLSERHMTVTGHELMIPSTASQYMLTRRTSFCLGRFKKSFPLVLVILTSTRKLDSGNFTIQVECKEKCFPILYRLRSTPIICRTGRTSTTPDDLSFHQHGEDLKTRFTTTRVLLIVRRQEFQRGSHPSHRRRPRQDRLL